MQQGVVLFGRVWQSLHARLWKMEGWNLIWTPPHFCSGRIPKSFATCHIPSDNVGQHATPPNGDVIHYMPLLRITDVDFNVLKLTLDLPHAL